MKLTFLESIKRVELFKNNPPRRVWVYSYRKTVARNGIPEKFEESSAICYAWFIWIKGYRNNPEIGWITKNGKLEFNTSKQTTLGGD